MICGKEGEKLKERYPKFVYQSMQELQLLLIVYIEHMFTGWIDPTMFRKGFNLITPASNCVEQNNLWVPPIVRCKGNHGHFKS